MGARSSNTDRNGHRNVSQNRLLNGHVANFFNSHLNAGSIGPNYSEGVASNPPSGHEASGGVKVDYTDPSGATYRTHVFLQPGTFTVSSLSPEFAATCDWMVLGGGGGGGYMNGGGGGAGGFRTNMPEQPGSPGGADPVGALPVSATTYTIVVGLGGGASGLSPEGNCTVLSAGLFGGSSSIATPTGTFVTATGGGGGGGYYNPTGQGWPGPNGGCGGGGNGLEPGPGPSGGGGGNSGSKENGTPTNPGNSVPAQGYPGGDASISGGNNKAGGGGGGVGAVGWSGGTPGSSTGSGSAQGGVGKTETITGQSIVVGAGGGGGKQDAAFSNAYGGSPSPVYPTGIGGRGGVGPGPGPGNDFGFQAVHSTGSGGGGSFMDESSSPAAGARSGNGASGMVCIRYKIGTGDVYNSLAKATGGEISFNSDGTKCYHRFRYPGTFATTAAISGAEIFVLGGGGGGGGPFGGGGGAGGYMLLTNQSIPSGTPNAVVVGNGGKGSFGGAVGVYNKGSLGQPGENSSITLPQYPTGSYAVTAGGGGGGGGYAQAGLDGATGSGPSTTGQGCGGGGGGADGGAQPGGTGFKTGGTGSSPNSNGGGGGGLTANGTPAPAPNYQSGPGGTGLQLPTNFQFATSGQYFGMSNSGTSVALGDYVGGGGGGAGSQNWPPSTPSGGGGGAPFGSLVPWSGGGAGGACSTADPNKGYENPGGKWGGAPGWAATGGGGGGGGRRTPTGGEKLWRNTTPAPNSDGPAESGGAGGGSGMVLIYYPTA